MVDTHAHLNFPELLSQIDKVVADSKTAGVTGIIIASSNLKDSQIAIELAQKYPGYLFASVGIHPQKTDPENKMTIEEQLADLDKLLVIHNPPPPPDSQLTSRPQSIVALGETGLDFSEAPPARLQVPERSDGGQGEETRPKEEQVALFQGHIKLSRKYNLPLIVHAREAVDEVLDTLQTVIHENRLRGVFHCYAGGKKRIAKVLALGSQWYFGFDGNLTYDEGLQAVLRLVPQERILIETDSPFLTPVPHRGETNTPAYLPLIQEKINEIFGRDLTKQIVKNTQKILNLH